MTVKYTNSKMPVVFTGHGTPMNAVIDNQFTRGWQALGKSIPKPEAVLVISAHWETAGMYVTYSENPPLIYDFRGFPPELYQIKYPVKGNPTLADSVIGLFPEGTVKRDYSRGIDHGAWCVLKHIFPDADVPVVQLSLNYNASPDEHYQTARNLAKLRDKNILILSSGNMVHSFRYASPQAGFDTLFGHAWAEEADADFIKLIKDNNFTELINYESHSSAFRNAVPTPEHYIPLLYTLALRQSDDEVAFFNKGVVAGSFSMTSVVIG